jgi:myo-inositol-1(or 4)-monophosphatase
MNSFSMEKYNDHNELAKKAALEAGKLLMKKFGNIKEMRYKAERSLVTEADLQAEELIISLIKEKYPDHRILDAKSDFTWVIDPLDGTANFAYGIPLFGVSIALLRGKETVLGVISIPYFKQLFSTVKGGGSFMNGKPTRVSERNSLSGMFLLYDSEFSEKKNEILAFLGRLTDSVFKVRILGASSLHFAEIAQGNVDLWVEHRTTPWDIAAGCLLVEEAGGKVTDFDGNPWTPWSGNLVVSNGKAHHKILEIINKSKK